MREGAPQRAYLRDVFNGWRYLAHTGCPWRYLPGDLPPWATVYQPGTCWRDARALEAIVHDLNELQRVLPGREATPSVAVLDGRTLQRTPESGHRAGGDGAKRRKGSKAPVAVDTLGQLLRVVITPAHEQERAQVSELCGQVQEVTGQAVTGGFVDQGYMGQQTKRAVAGHDADLQVVKKPEGQRGQRLFGLLASLSWPASSRQRSVPKDAVAVAELAGSFSKRVI